MPRSDVTLIPALPADYPAFRRALQDAFGVAVRDELGTLPDGPIPSDADLDAAMAAPNARILHVLEQGRTVGGAVVTIDAVTHDHSLDLFFVAVGHHGRGLGRKAWFAIEAMFPGARTWQRLRVSRSATSTSTSTSAASTSSNIIMRVTRTRTPPLWRACPTTATCSAS